MASSIRPHFLCIGVLLCFLKAGIALDCYLGTCTNMTGNFPPGIPTHSCSPPPTYTKHKCGILSGGLTADRCITTRTTVKGSIPAITSVTSESRKCTSSMLCSDAAFKVICNKANSTGVLKSCEIGCCEGNLCNSGGPIPTMAPQPSGSDLSCYACTDIAIPGSVLAETTCTNPVNQTCGDDSVANMKQDRCARLTMKVGGVQKEIRNCSGAFFCNKPIVCNLMKQLGQVTDCDVSCCFGKYCNKGIQSTTVITATTDEGTSQPTTMPSNGTDEGTSQLSTDENKVTASSGILACDLLIVISIVMLISLVTK